MQIGVADFIGAIAGASGRIPGPVHIDGDTVGLLLYTSGTTGVPKGALARHSALTFNGTALARWCAVDSRGKILAIAPLFHITGIVCHIVAAFGAQCSLILNYRFEASVVLDAIREHRPTYSIGAITAFNALMNIPDACAADFACFNSIYSGGAPIPPVLRRKFRERFGKPIHSSFGMTESAAPTHLCPLGVEPPVDPESGALSIGVPIYDTDAIIVDEEGRSVRPGIAGELWMRGPQIMVGYWNKPEQTAEAMTDGWLHSGDIAVMDEAGWFYLVDRKKDVIIASGFKVWPREVEDVLYSHSAVREAAVVGVPDSYRGETVKAFISLKPGMSADSEELIEHCRARLASYKAPRSIEFMAEIPKTVSGKIQRSAVRELGRKGLRSK
jgi:long-chain acyl-CoA synthetase